MDRVTEERLEVGRRIKSLRELCRLTQDELAARTSVSRGAISAYERGLNAPTPMTVGKLAEVLGVEPREIMPEAIREAMRIREEAFRAEALERAHERRSAERAKAQAQANEAKAERKRRQTADEQPQQPTRAAWLDEAKAAAARRELDARARERKRKKSRPQETGATSGFIFFRELADMPEFLRETLIDMHIRRMLWLCGEHRRLGSVKKTRTPAGVAWTTEGAA